MIDTPSTARIEITPVSMIETPSTDRRASVVFVLEDSNDIVMERKKTLLSVPVLFQGAKERDSLPHDVWDDLMRNSRVIYFSLMYLSAAVMWAFYSCLSAQDFYTLQFPDTKFTFLTTLVTSWPQVFGHSTQLLFGLDRKISQSTRFISGFVMFMIMGVCIMLLSAVQWENQTLGATLVLVCIGVTGLANCIPQSVLYGIAALFPMERFTNAVQIGNVCAGVFNVTLNTVLRLLIGGIDQTANSQKLSFYLFFGMLLLVCVIAIAVYRHLMTLHCVQYLVARNAFHAEPAHLQTPESLEGGVPASTKTTTDSMASRISNLVRVFKLVAGPAMAQFVLYFVTLAVYPGIGCAAGRILDDSDLASKWYCAPGVVGIFNYGDCLGRVICTAGVYRVFTMKRSILLIVLRIAFIPLLLLNVYGSSLYVFGENSPSSSPSAPLLYGLAMNLFLGISGGLLGTVTMGAAPLLVGPEDREAVSSVMVLFMFLGISCGSLGGYLIATLHLFGL